MPHIFISYASEDRAVAQTLAEALQQEGWTVWWDRKIPVGKSFHEVIEEAIDAARCVLVIWTEHSVESDWVRNEADEGNRRGQLVPVRMGDVRIPLGFRHLQAADLLTWRPGVPHAEYDSLLESIRGVFGQPAPQPKPERPRRVEREPAQPSRSVEPAPREDSVKQPPRSRKMAWIAAGIGIAVIGGSIITAIEEGEFDGSAQMIPMDTDLGGSFDANALSAIGGDVQSSDTKGGAPGQQWSVQWQDHAVRFDGKLSYSGGTQGQIQATLHDLSSGATLGNQSFPVQLQATGVGQYAIGGEVVIPNGDSATQGRHTHAVFIQLQQMANGNVVAQNCTMQGCYPASVTPESGY